MTLEWHQAVYLFKKGRAAAKYGVCSDCCYLFLRVFETEEIALCGRMHSNPLRVNSGHPVLDCSDYYQKGQLALAEMEKIAYLIDVQTRQAGFSSETVVTVKKPKDED